MFTVAPRPLLHNPAPAAHRMGARQDHFSTATTAPDIGSRVRRRRELTAAEPLPGDYPSARICEIARELTPGKSVRDRGVGGSNPLAPTNFSQKSSEIYRVQSGRSLGIPPEISYVEPRAPYFKRGLPTNCSTFHWAIRLSCARLVVLAGRFRAQALCSPYADGHPAVAFVASLRQRFLEVRPVSRTNGLRTVSRPSSSWPSWKSSE
jgi:hypothetical protein